MMQKKLLKTTLFGFSKTEVCEYIARVNSEFHEKFNALNEEHTKEKKELSEQIAALTEEINEYKKANGDIAKALFDAQQYASELKAKADGEYQKATEELTEMKESETEKLNTYRNRIEDVRKEIASLLADIDEKLVETEKNIVDLAAEYQSEEEVAV